jgi:tetratricopeptide (TPR) repeat protein
VLAELGRQQYNVGHLEKAAATYAEILAAPPLEQDNSIVGTLRLLQGQTLLLIGGRPGQKAAQERAAGILREGTAAAEDSRDPNLIGSTCVALGDALVAMAAGEQRAILLNEAARLYETARLAISYETTPFEWIQLYFKLGSVVGTLARDAKDDKQIHDALSLLETALQGIPPGLFREQRAEILLEIGHLHATRAIGDHWYGPLQRAIEAYDRALTEPDLKSHKSFLWAQNKQRWATAKLRIARHRKDAGLTGVAIAGLLEALQTYDLQKHSRQYASIQHDLGSAFFLRAELLLNEEDLAAAEAAFLRALELRPAEQLPMPWAQSLLGLASVLTAAMEHDPSRASELQDVADQLQRALGLAALQDKPAIIDTIATQLDQVRIKLAKTEAESSVGVSVHR